MYRIGANKIVEECKMQFLTEIKCFIVTTFLDKLLVAPANIN